MMDTLPLIYAWGASALLLSWILAALYPLMRRRFGRLAAFPQSKVILCYALLPLITASIVLLLYTQPTINQHLVYAHCHGEICGPHWLHLPLSEPQSGAVAALVLFAFLAICMIVVKQILSGRKYMKRLEAATDRESDRSYRVIETEKPLAWCAGLWCSQIYVSRGLLNLLTKQQLDVVLAHEQCHASNRDNVRRSLLHWCTLTWPKRIKRQIRRDFTVSIEMSCDVAAVINHPRKELQQATALIADYCSRESETVDHRLDVRADKLQQELQKLQQIGGLTFHKTAIQTMALLTAWLSFAVVASILIHPVLEWLSL